MTQKLSKIKFKRQSLTKRLRSKILKTKKKNNKKFAKESRDRKKRYVKELEKKIEMLEDKIQSMGFELTQYKNLLKISDISEVKNTKLTTVCKDFSDIKTYVKEQAKTESIDKGFSDDHWRKVIQLSEVDIGPNGQLRRKLLKSSFKVIIKHIVPEQLAFPMYLAEFDRKATKRDLGFMKKFNRLELEHYLDEKDYQGFDRLYALCGFDDNEIKYFDNLKPTMLYFRKQVKGIIYTLLKCLKNIYELAQRMDEYLKQVHENLRPRTAAKFVKNFYRTPNANCIYKIWGLKRRSIVHDQKEAEEVYAMTDSDEE